MEIEWTLNRFEVLKRIHHRQLTDGEWPKIADIADYYNDEQDVPREKVKELINSYETAGYLHISHDKIILQDAGLNYLLNTDLQKNVKQNSRLNSELIDHQKRSAAVETLFTVALLLFTAAQITMAANSPPLTISKIFFLIGVPITATGILSIALLIGGENLVEAIKTSYNEKLK